MTSPDDADAFALRAETIAASLGVARDAEFGAVAPPLYLTSTYAFEDFGRPGKYDYGRAGNPNRDLLAETLARLEGGAGAVITSSGMAAIDLLVGRLGPADLVVAPHDCYWGVYRLFSARAALGQMRVIFVNQCDPAELNAALAQRPALVWLETPSNPLMRIVDIRHLATLAHDAGARLAVDNTFLSPAAQTPILHGADFVIHSTTKYLNGHSDVIGGAVIAADPAHVADLRSWANVVGAVGAPFDAWLTLRGVRTLFARMERQQRTAGAIATYLAHQSGIGAVHYPGLQTHPGHAIAARQQTGFGAMMSFELAGGVAAVRRFLKAMRVFTLAESLGGVESLVAHPTTMTHADMGEVALAAAGISDGLLRLSVGLEHEGDLTEGLARGLAAA